MKGFLKNLPLRLILLGAVAWTVARWLGGIAETMGANGAMIGMGAAQLVIFIALSNARVLGLPKPVWGGKILIGIGVGLVAVALTSALQCGWEWILGWMGYEIVEQPAVTVLRILSGAELGGLIFMSGLIGPVVEEVYFRFWWLDWLRNKTTDIEAVLIIALTFALLHGSAIAAPGLFVLAAICGFVRLRWGLASAIACHSIFNIVTIIAVRGGWL